MLTVKVECGQYTIVRRNDVSSCCTSLKSGEILCSDLEFYSDGVKRRNSRAVHMMQNPKREPGNQSNCVTKIAVSGTLPVQLSGSEQMGKMASIAL